MTDYVYQFETTDIVSIHTSTWEVTSVSDPSAFWELVSIHTSTWEVTKIQAF